jgi:hypothetical protein
VAQEAFSGVSHYSVQKQAGGHPTDVASVVSLMKQLFFVAGCYGNLALSSTMF